MIRVMTPGERLAAAFARLATEVAGAARVMRECVEVIVSSIEADYRAGHGGRLPGSTRTARLRKKRRDRVMQWAHGQQEAP